MGIAIFQNRKMILGHGNLQASTGQSQIRQQLGFMCLGVLTRLSFGFFRFRMNTGVNKLHTRGRHNGCRQAIV